MIKVFKSALLFMAGSLLAITVVGAYPGMLLIAKAIEVWRPEAIAQWRKTAPVFTGAINVRVVNDDK